MKVDAIQAVPHHHPGHHHPSGPSAEPPSHPVEDHGLGKINWFNFNLKEQPPYAASILNFAILLAIYFVFGRRPLAAMLRARRAKVATAIEEASRIKEEAEERSKHYRSKLNALDAEVTAVHQSLIETGKGERARLIRDAEETAARIRTDAERMLEQELEQMRQDLTRETVEMAARAARDLLGQTINSTDHARVAQEYLDDLRRLPSKEAANKAPS